MKRGLYWEAWKLLPFLAKLGVFFAYIVSSVMIWAGFSANPNYDCITGACEINNNLILQTKLSGVAFIVLMTVILGVSLYLLAKTLEEKHLTFEQAKEKIEKAMGNDEMFCKCQQIIDPTTGLLLIHPKSYHDPK